MCVCDMCTNVLHQQGASLVLQVCIIYKCCDMYIKVDLLAMCHLGTMKCNVKLINQIKLNVNLIKAVWIL